MYKEDIVKNIQLARKVLDRAERRVSVAETEDDYALVIDELDVAEEHELQAYKAAQMAISNIEMVED